MRSASAFRASATSLPLVITLAALLSGCQPTVKIEAPTEPIVINLNIKIEQEIRIKIDSDLDDLFEEEEGLF